jgi:hypothetical protein
VLNIGSCQHTTDTNLSEKKDVADAMNRYPMVNLHTTQGRPISLLNAYKCKLSSTTRIEGRVYAFPNSPRDAPP